MTKDKMPSIGQINGVRFRVCHNTIIFSSEKEDTYVGVHYVGAFEAEDDLEAAVANLTDVYREQRGIPAGFKMASDKPPSSCIEGIIEKISGHPLDTSILRMIVYRELVGDESVGDAKTCVYPSGHILIERKRPAAGNDPLYKVVQARDMYACDELLLEGALKVEEETENKEKEGV